MYVFMYKYTNLNMKMKINMYIYIYIHKYLQYTYRGNLHVKLMMGSMVKFSPWMFLKKAWGIDVRL